MRDIPPNDCSRHGLAKEEWFPFRRFEEKIEELSSVKGFLIRSSRLYLGQECSMHVAFSPTLEQTFMPNANSVVEAVGQLVGW